METGRLYKVLNQMLKDNWLENRWEKSPIDPKKKLYKLGKVGKAKLDKILMNLVREIHTDYGEYLLGLPHDKHVFKTISNTITCETSRQSNIALVADTSSPIIPICFFNLQFLNTA